MVNVTSSHVELQLQPGDAATRFDSYWLKRLALRKVLYAGTTHHWTDGANVWCEPQGILEDDAIEDASVRAGDLVVTWRGGPTCRFPLNHLCAQACQSDPPEEVCATPWDDSTFKFFDHDAVMNPAGNGDLAAFLEAFLRFGIGFIANVPPHEYGTRAVANRLSTIDRTHLGDLFRLREKAGAIHIGEMSVDIPLHTDMVYKQRVPELQMLHVLEAADSGGENVFVDSMALLPDMLEPDIALLRDNPVWFVAQSDAVSFRGLHPVLAFDARRRFRGVHFNEYKLVLPVHLPEAYYFALMRLRRLMNNPVRCKAVALPSGSVVLFHNLRVLHARRAFTGGRHVVGCYLSEEDFKSNFRINTRRATP
jgi:alpha-ketoglutarate-dependent taurine dioxygenase